jgi:hypothetical protein
MGSDIMSGSNDIVQTRFGVLQEFGNQDAAGLDMITATPPRRPECLYKKLHLDTGHVASPHERGGGDIAAGGASGAEK